MGGQGTQRPTKDECYLDVAEQVALRSTCLRRNFGAVIVNHDQIHGQLGKRRTSPPITWKTGPFCRAVVGYFHTSPGSKR